jgi:23S rRNA (cytosine1962-C5)-methyltransferase
MRYQLLDCGDGLKLEDFGGWKIIRPAPQAMWGKFKPEMWESADSEFTRTEGEKGSWKALSRKAGTPSGLPEEWDIVNDDGIKFVITPNQFGNVGVFTEHWSYVPELGEELDPKSPILNLFTYSGSNCVGLAKRGFKIVAVDSSKSAMNMYTTNLAQNGIDRSGHKLVLEDCFKFVEREGRRGSKYKTIMMDPPSYGRGTKGEIFAIEEHLTKLVKSCLTILTPDGELILTTHSPRFTPENLRIFIQSLMPERRVTVSEILNPCVSGVSLPSGMIVKSYV